MKKIIKKTKKIKFWEENKVLVTSKLLKSLKICQNDQKQIKLEKVPGKYKSDKRKLGIFFLLSAMSKDATKCNGSMVKFSNLGLENYFLIS